MPRLGDLYYEVQGEGPNLLLLAGVGTDLQSWLYQVEGLAPVARVIALDHRASGRSASPAGSLSLQDMADDAATLLREVGPAVVMGHSMGGFVAQRLALSHQDLVDGLVLANTSARLDPFGLALLDVWVAQKRAGLSRETFARGFFPWIFSRRFFENPLTLEAAVRLYAENPYPQGTEDLARQVDACRSHDTRALLGGIEVPALVIVAGADAVTPPELGRELAAGIPGARCVELPGVGHASMNEDPLAFNAAVRDFLAQRAARPAGSPARRA